MLGWFPILQVGLLLYYYFTKSRYVFGRSTLCMKAIHSSGCIQYGLARIYEVASQVRRAKHPNNTHKGELAYVQYTGWNPGRLRIGRPLEIPTHLQPQQLSGHHHRL